MITEPRFDWIDEPGSFEQVIDELLGVDRYALDTEFHRERTFFPKLALVQVAFGERIALIDPLAVDITRLGTTFGPERTVVIHAAQQDLDVLEHAVGRTPSTIFDTQLAAGFVGYGTPSLGSLLQGEIGVQPAKGDRLTDWLRRPLSVDQLRYAALDVAYLLEVHDRLIAELGSLGRLRWVEEACTELSERPASGAHPERAWTRVKDARTLKPRARAVAQSVAAWRERRAMAVDQPVRHVLADLAVIGIAQRQPTTLDDLAACRGVDGRSLRGRVAEEILVAVAEGLGNEPPDPPGSSDDLERDLRPVVALVTAWIAQLARDERIDPALLATRADIVAHLRRESDARLGTGWRASVVGDGIDRLVGGRAALGFEPGRGLRLLDLPAD